jgi:hypothetical protein
MIDIAALPARSGLEQSDQLLVWSADKSVFGRTDLFRARGSRRITPWEYGAVGDGVTDDTAALQAMFAAAEAGDCVDFGSDATFLVTPIADLPTLLIPVGATVVGNGAALKVADDAGPYNTLLGCYLGTNVTVAGLVFDGNRANNEVSASWTLPNGNVLLGCGVAAGFTVVGCRFDNVDSVNCVAVSVGTDVAIVDNTFTNVGGDQQRDCSVVYIAADGMTITGNHIYGSATDIAGAVGGIETHGSHQVIANNIVARMHTGIYATGVAETSDGITVSGNTVVDCGRGVFVLGAYFGDNTTNPSPASVTVVGNTIRCDLDRWGDWWQPASAGFGVGLSADYTSGVRIAGNVIDCVANTTSFTSSADDTSAGVRLFAGSNPAAWSDVAIAGNTIRSWPSSGVLCAADVVGLCITDNQIVACGGPQVSDNYFRAGVSVGGAVEALLVARNHVTDPTGTRTKYGVLNYSTATAGNRIVDNDVVLPNGFAPLFLNATALVRHAGAGSPESSVTASVGSVWTRTDGGTGTTMYMKESGTGNTGWAAK